MHPPCQSVYDTCLKYNVQLWDRVVLTNKSSLLLEDLRTTDIADMRLGFMHPVSPRLNRLRSVCQENSVWCGLEYSIMLNISEYIGSKARVTKFDLPWSNSPDSQQNRVTLKFCNQLYRMRRSLIGPEVSDRKFSVLQEIGLVMWSISVGRCWRINQ